MSTVRAKVIHRRKAHLITVADGQIPPTIAVRPEVGPAFARVPVVLDRALRVRAGLQWNDLVVLRVQDRLLLKARLHLKNWRENIRECGLFG